MSNGQAPARREPEPDCLLCPRLAAYRHCNRTAAPGWHNAPVATFGDAAARALIVGLAPGLRGANRTGRPFTGDFAGELLYSTLLACGFAEGAYDARPDDSLRLIGVAITNAVRCAPPQNKPTPGEIAACRPFLAATLSQSPRLLAIVALGRVAHESVVRAMCVRPAAFAFAHGAVHDLTPERGQPLRLFDSYHCSRYNTNTGVLTAAIAQLARSWHLNPVFQCRRIAANSALRRGAAKSANARTLAMGRRPSGMMR